jgi:hypothetical protein
VEAWVDGHWDPSSLLPRLRALPNLRVLGLNDDAFRHVARKGMGWTPAAAKQLSTLTQLCSLWINLANPPRRCFTHLSCLTALNDLCLFATGTAVTDQDLLQLLPLQELTCLKLGGLQRLCAWGLLPLLEALPKLQRLELEGELWGVEEGQLLAEGLLPLVLPRLTRLELVGVPMQSSLCDAVLSAAEVYDCRCELRGCGGDVQV